MTVERLLTEVSSHELSAWMAFYKAEAAERAEAETKRHVREG